MEILQNKNIGNYTTLNYLGSGNFSSVYSAIHNFTREQVALKIAHTKDKYLIQKYNDSVKSALTGLLKINHPNIIGIREYFVATIDGVENFVLVLDLIKAQAMDKTANIISLPDQDKLAIFIKLCKAISYAHQFEYFDTNEFHTSKHKGIIHGDIKPANILLTPEMDPKVIDFSFLNFRKSNFDKPEKLSKNEVGTEAFGTPGYMAPEQEQSHITNEKTDIFSLGVVLRKLFYGFNDEIPLGQSEFHKNLQKVIEKATNNNANFRYSTVDELINETERLNKAVPVHKKWLSIAAVALIVIISTIFLYDKISRPTSNQESSKLTESSPSNEVCGAVTKNAAANIEVDINKNKYYALLIGNNDYKYWNKLEYPISDIAQMKKTLNENYTFETNNIKSIINGSYETIYKAFESFTDHGPNTFLLIYYAGHGKYDEVTGKAALIPVDAEKNSDSKNLTSDLLRDLLKKCKIHNILFISDACYLGAMASRGTTSDSITTPDISSFNKFASKQSRKFISSGAKETVPDKSYFNEFLIKYLNNNTSNIVFEYALYNDIIEPIRRNSHSTPVFGVFFDTKDEGGYFYFVKRNK